MERLYLYLALIVSTAVVLPSLAKTDGKQTSRTIQMEKKVTKVTDGVLLATGYGFSNMIMIEGDDGLVAVDSLSYPHQALEAYKDLTKHTNKTLSAVILTHFHLDHIGGANALKKIFGDSNTKIYSHHTMEYERSRFARVAPFYVDRAANLFGKEIYPKALPCIRNNQACMDTVTVTDTLGDGDDLNIQGIDIKILHTRGETDDQISVWIGSKHLLISADTLYPFFPNIYSLRGTPPRDAFAWYQSVGRMRELDPHHLIPCHGEAIQGSMQVDIALTIYRDGIQHIHDQTVRMMNKGLSLDATAATVKLPSVLASRKILNQVYGKVEWSVRGIYDYYNGWFDGEVENIAPISRSKKAKLMADLLSIDHPGTAYEKLIHYANLTLSKFDDNDNNDVDGDQLSWGLYLCVMASEIGTSEDLKRVTMELAKAMIKTNKHNMIAYNFYFVYLKRLQNDGKALFPFLNPIKHLPLNQALEAIPYRFKAESCNPGLIMRILLHITDVPNYSNAYIMRNCIIEHVTHPKPDDFIHVISLSVRQFRQIFSKEKEAKSIINTSDEKLQILEDFLSFLD